MPEDQHARRRLLHALLLLPAIGLLTVIVAAATHEPRARSCRCGLRSDSSNIRGIIQANILWAQSNPTASSADDPAGDEPTSP